MGEAEAEGGMTLGWTILLGVTILVLTLLYWIIQQRRDQPPPGIKQLPAFPGICWPLIGQLPTVMQWPSNGQHHAIEKVINETKESSLLLRVPGITAVLTVDPEYVRHITATKFGTIYEKGEVMHRMFYDFLGNGIFNVNGEEWQRHRRLAQNLFHKKSLEAHVPVFIRAAERVADRLVALSKEKEYEQNGLDIQDFCMRATLDSFAEIGFGVALNSIDEERNEFAIAFDKVQTKTQLRNRQGELWPLIETVFPDRDFRDQLDYLNTLVHQIIASRKTQSLEEVQQSTDALSAMLAQGVDYSDEELRDFVMNFLLAGRDTTSTLLTWTFYYLSLHPEVERKMVEEIQSVIGEEELTCTLPMLCIDEKLCLKTRKSFDLSALILYPQEDEKITNILLPMCLSITVHVLAWAGRWRTKRRVSSCVQSFVEDFASDCILDLNPSCILPLSSPPRMECEWI